MHFDAKYRITDLTGLVGKGPSSDKAERKEIKEKKANSTTNTYRRGALLKMHTYKDAIRRTIGSYVLYPGSDEKDEKRRFRLFEEVPPGVGAFAIKPRHQSDCGGRAERLHRGGHQRECGQEHAPESSELLHGDGRKRAFKHDADH